VKKNIEKYSIVRVNPIEKIILNIIHLRKIKKKRLRTEETIDQALIKIIEHG
jgi:hypothetical protein